MIIEFINFEEDFMWSRSCGSILKMVCFINPFVFGYFIYSPSFLGILYIYFWFYAGLKLLRPFKNCQGSSSSGDVDGIHFTIHFNAPGRSPSPVCWMHIWFNVKLYSRATYWFLCILWLVSKDPSLVSSKIWSCFDFTRFCADSFWCIFTLSQFCYLYEVLWCPYHFTIVIYCPWWHQWSVYTPWSAPPSQPWTVAGPWPPSAP